MQPVRGRAKKRAHLPEGFSVQEAERLFVGPGGCEANAQMSYWAVLPVSQRTPRTHPSCTELIGESGRCSARSEVGRGSGGRGGGSGGSRDRCDLRALAGCPVGLECLPGLKFTTANLRSCQFNVFARLEVRIR